MKSQNQNNNVIEKKICDKNKKVRNFLLYFLKILGVFYQAISRVVVLALTKNWHDFILAIVDKRHIIFFFDWRPASPKLGISKQADKATATDATQKPVATSATLCVWCDGTKNPKHFMSHVNLFTSRRQGLLLFRDAMFSSRAATDF